jgi:hypothetical protein
VYALQGSKYCSEINLTLTWGSVTSNVDGIGKIRALMMPEIQIQRRKFDDLYMCLPDKQTI